MDKSNKERRQDGGKRTEEKENEGDERKGR